MLFVPEDGAGSGIVRFSGFPRSHALVVLSVCVRVSVMCMYVCVRVCVCACATTYRIASSTHFATGAISRARATLPAV